MMRQSGTRRPAFASNRLAAAVRAFMSGVALLATVPTSADTIVIPNVTGFVYGAQSALWSTEIRITNLSDSMKQLRVVEWIGIDGALQTLEVQPGETRIISGWELIYGGTRGSVVSLDEDIYGAAVCEREEGLFVQSAILSQTSTPPFAGMGSDAPCFPWAGGHEVGQTLIWGAPGFLGH